MSEHIIHTSLLPVPVKVFVERRNNSRASLASEYIIIRLPIHISNEEKNKRLKEHIDWAVQQLRKKNYYEHRKRSAADYQDQVLRLCETEFKITLHDLYDGKNKLSYRKDGVLHIFLRTDQDEKHRIAEIKRLLIKFAEKYFLSFIQQRVDFFNDTFFREPINKVRLNHTVSKWGSCSANRNVMFSTKLLLLPAVVTDYVIIHELAHLKEMNHSDKFWNEVKRAMPEYKKWDKWLTRNGGSFDF